MRRLAAAADPARWSGLRAEIEANFAIARELNLDKKQTMLGAFFAIEDRRARTASLAGAGSRPVPAHIWGVERACTPPGRTSSRRRSTTSTIRRISATPIPPWRPTRWRASCGSTGARHVPHRHRRARPEGRQSARAAGVDPQEFCRPRLSQNFRDMATADEHLATTTSSAPPSRATRARARRLWQELRPPVATSISASSPAGIRCATRRSTTRASWSTAQAPAPTGAEVDWVEEENYFFRLSAWQERLLEAITRRHPDFIAPRAPPQRGGELRQRRPPRPVDLAHQLLLGRAGAGRPKHVMYVWLDALTNYLTAVGYPETVGRQFTTFWPADLHMVGKDIVRFHCVYWPAFLMAAGHRRATRVFAHGWWTVEGQKMSKSLGNCHPAAADLVETYGVDPMRYFLLRELPFGSDGDFSRRAVVRHQRRPRQRFRQSGAARAVDDPALLRGACPRPARLPTTTLAR